MASIHRTRRPIIAGVLLGTALTAGCVTLPLWTGQRADDRPAAPVKPTPQPGAPHVSVGGDGLQLGDVAEAGLSHEAFLNRVTTLQRDGRAFSCRAWVSSYPDVAAAVLRADAGRLVGDPALMVIARETDRQAGTPASAGWTAVIQDRTANPRRYAEFDSARAALYERMRSSRPETTRGDLPGAPRGTPGSYVAADAAQARGEWLLLTDKPGEAVTALRQAADALKTAHPSQAARVLLLLSEAQRRAGHPDQAARSWQAAAAVAGSAKSLVPDPALWEQLASLRPLQTPWPRDVLARIGRTDEPGQVRPVDQADADEASVWSAVAGWRLDRREGQAALVAFKRAERFTADAIRRDHLELGEAKALVQLDQPAAAVAVLARLAQQPNPAVSLPAMAILGAIKYQQGQVKQALALLKQAVEQDRFTQWAGRPQAEADLGLAYLTTGDEANGLRLLHAAAEHFEQSGGTAGLLHTLGNEAAYLDHTGKGEAAGLVQVRIKQIESDESNGSRD